MKKQIKDLIPKDKFIVFFIEDEHAANATLLDVDTSDNRFTIFVADVDGKKMAITIYNDYIRQSVSPATYLSKDEIGNDYTVNVDLCVDLDALVESVKYNLTDTY